MHPKEEKGKNKLILLNLEKSFNHFLKSTTEMFATQLLLKY